MQRKYILTLIKHKYALFLRTMQRSRRVRLTFVSEVSLGSWDLESHSIHKSALIRSRAIQRLSPTRSDVMALMNFSLRERSFPSASQAAHLIKCDEDWTTWGGRTASRPPQAFTVSRAPLWMLGVISLCVLLYRYKALTS